jgi:hypothetical protein
MKALFAAVLLLTLTACNPVRDPAAKPASNSTTGKSLPYAPPPPPLPDEGVACSADVRQCDDGSFVGRNSDRGCEFDPCPGEINK